jgi:hypothetical protein
LTSITATGVSNVANFLRDFSPLWLPGASMWADPGSLLRASARARVRRYVVEGAARSTEEMRERERLADPERPNMIRKAAEVHRRVRKYAREELLKPGMPLIDICERLENATRVYLEANKSPTAGTRAGIGA